MSRISKIQKPPVIITTRFVHFLSVSTQQINRINQFLIHKQILWQIRQSILLRPSAVLYSICIPVHFAVRLIATTRRGTLRCVLIQKNLQVRPLIDTFISLYKFLYSFISSDTYLCDLLEISGVFFLIVSGYNNLPRIKYLTAVLETS